jgi:pilus assembly protein Flp/PilA
MSKFFLNFIYNEDGAAAAEYALIVAVVGIGIAIAAATLGDAISDAMDDVAAVINGDEG